MVLSVITCLTIKSLFFLITGRYITSGWFILSEMFSFHTTLVLLPDKEYYGVGYKVTNGGNNERSSALCRYNDVHKIIFSYYIIL